MLLFSFLYSYPALRPFFSSYGKEGLRERVICLDSFFFMMVYFVFLKAQKINERILGTERM